MYKADFQKQIAPLLPNEPGVYRYYDSGKRLLYVGKAKNLKKRVTSYFTKDFDNYKTKVLVDKIHSAEWTVTENEHDAFLLENSLIKHFKPPYNISLKDDKSYPFVVIKNEHFPRIYLTRRRLKDGGEYIGPFTSVMQVKELLNIIKSNYKLRTCNLNLQPAAIRLGKFKCCLEYHIGNCKAPCESKQSEADYNTDVQEIRQLLKGNLTGLLNDIKSRMQLAADNLDFERAQTLKESWDLLQNYHTKSTVVNPRLGDLDIATIVEHEEEAYVNYMMVSEGSIIQSKSFIVEKKLTETTEEILSHAVALLRTKFESTAKEIIVPFQIETTDPQLIITLPIVGDKKKLLDLSYKNTNEFIRQNSKKKSLMMQPKTDEDYLKVILKLKTEMKLNQIPTHIECFDNSNFQGSFPVAAMVCFKDGKPSKSDYRHFHIKTVEGINDFASMSEIVFRRYDRLLKENQPLPQLVIIDGGKGQLSAAMKSITELNLQGKMTVVGLAKREESIFFPGDSEPLQLPYNGESLLLIRRIRDEVHRFGITFHRLTRSKGTIKNELESIEGVGQKTAETLLQRFRSVKTIKELTQRELTQVIGASKAKIVHQYFHPEADQ